MVQYASPATLGHNLKYAHPAIFDDTVVLCSLGLPQISRIFFGNKHACADSAFRKFPRKKGTSRRTAQRKLQKTQRKLQ